MSTAEILPFPLIARQLPPPEANDVRPASEASLADLLPAASLPPDPRLVVRFQGVELEFADEAALRAEILRQHAADERRRQAEAFDAAPAWARIHFEYAAVAEYLGAVLAGLCAAVWFWSLPL